MLPDPSCSASLGALLLLIIAAYHNPDIRDNRMFVYTLLAIMGVGISITFGAFVQIVAMFPPSLHPFFFMGTYAPFFIFAPVNVGIGDLCEQQTDVRRAAAGSRSRLGPVGSVCNSSSLTPTTTAPNQQAMGGEVWELRWNSVLVYYIVAIVITLAGLMCFYGIAFHPFGKQMFVHKDEELKRQKSRLDTSINVRCRRRMGVLWERAVAPNRKARPGLTPTHCPIFHGPPFSLLPLSPFPPPPPLRTTKRQLSSCTSAPGPSRPPRTRSERPATMQRCS